MGQESFSTTTGMRVTFPAMQAGADAITSIQTNLNGHLEDLATFISNVVDGEANWDGAARTAYAAQKLAWDEAQLALNDLLGKIGTAVRTSGESYADMERRNVGMWDQGIMG